MEQWKPIPGYEGIYEASSLGNIRSAPGKVTSNAKFPHREWKTRILKTKTPVSARRHDKRVTLWKNGAAKDHLVARLVASAWYGPPGDGMTVNHINGDYTDNRPENLEWLSRHDNIIHGFKNGLFDSFQKKVALISDSGESIVAPSLSEASRRIGRNHGYISCRVKRGCYYAISADGARYQVAFLK